MVIQRGGCAFKVKAINAQEPGRGAVVIYNNADGPLNGTLGSIGQNIPVIGTLRRSARRSPSDRGRAR